MGAESVGDYEQWRIKFTVASVLTTKFKYLRNTALCEFGVVFHAACYITAKYVADQFSEHIKNYPHSSGGGGSMIDGTVLTDKKITFSSCLTGKNSIVNVYHVENDCALYLGYTGDIENNNKLVFYIKGNTVVSLNSNGGSSATVEGAGSIIHVKKGVVIQASVSNWNSSTKKCMMEFIEYKLS